MHTNAAVTRCVCACVRAHIQPELAPHDCLAEPNSQDGFWVCERSESELHNTEQRAALQKHLRPKTSSVGPKGRNHDVEEIRKPRAIGADESLKGLFVKSQFASRGVGTPPVLVVVL